MAQSQHSIQLHHCICVCRLEEAYEAAVQQLGGLQAARPKQLLQILQPEFPDLALQSIKW